MTPARPSVLTTICDRRRIEASAAERLRSMAELERSIAANPRPRRSLRAALTDRAGQPVRVIAEFKRASPSAGPIFGNANVTDVVQAYDRAGAAAVSVLTEPTDFGGSLDDLCAARKVTNLPLLRKDFMVTPYQFYEAAEAGADIVLLIAAALTVAEVHSFAALAHSLHLEVLLEIHAANELEGIDVSQVDVIGVNNRNLHTLKTDVQTSFDLRDRLPDSSILISESGLSDAATVGRLAAAGYRGFLIGESLMKTGNPGQALMQLIAAAAESV